jgi:hypothetical protein
MELWIAWQTPPIILMDYCPVVVEFLPPVKSEWIRTGLLFGTPTLFGCGMAFLAGLVIDRRKKG